MSAVEEEVDVYVARACNFNTGETVKRYEPGVHTVPLWMKDHWYFKLFLGDPRANKPDDAPAPAVDTSGLQQQLEEQRQRTESAEQRLKALGDKHTALQAEHDDLKVQHEKLQSEHKELQQDFDKLDEEAAAAETRVKELTKNLKGAAAEAPKKDAPAAAKDKAK